METASRLETARSLFRRALLARKGLFVQAAAAALLANVLALATALYSMQVYDRVIPTQGISTLIVLTGGVLLAAVLELVVKLVRSHVLETSIRGMDLDLSHAIFRRLLGIRLDQFPAAIGSLSAQLKSYETIRAFLSSATLYLLVDAPFALLFLGVIALIAGPSVAVIPAVFFVLALGVGLFHKRRIVRHAESGYVAANKKLGLLVETIEAAENIKAAGAQQRQTERWNELSRQSVDDDMTIRRVSESAAYQAAFIQQMSYVLLVAMGAWIAATSSELTVGGIIASAILSGRVLAPVAALPGLLVQAAHARVALDALEKVFALQTDNHAIEKPLKPERIHGEWRVSDLKFTYPGHSRPSLVIPNLQIKKGEKIGVIGPIGSGKSTLLKLLAGLYAPPQGQLLLDGLEIQQIDRTVLSCRLGYLPQETRLLAGTLRENLTAGIDDPGEEAILEVCRLTGLDALIAAHPRGLEMPLGEGGQGVSGGQRQLVVLTRLLLARPSAWLLDEPTASMDEQSEARAIEALSRSLTEETTLIVVTHKPVLLNLVERLVVLLPGGGLMDGPKDAVLAQLRQNALRSIDSQKERRA